MKDEIKIAVKCFDSNEELAEFMGLYKDGCDNCRGSGCDECSGYGYVYKERKVGCKMCIGSGYLFQEVIGGILHEAICPICDGEGSIEWTKNKG